MIPEQLDLRGCHGTFLTPAIYHKAAHCHLGVGHFKPT
jgi:hypothetical protein